MSEVEIVNAKIVKTTLGIEDHGILTCMMHLEWPGAGCGFGGYRLDAYDKAKDHWCGHAYGSWFIRRVLETIGVDNWEDLRGKYVRAESTGWGGGITRIGHITDDKWFDPKAEWKEQTQ